MFDDGGGVLRAIEIQVQLALGEGDGELGAPFDLRGNGADKVARQFIHRNLAGAMNLVAGKLRKHLDGVTMRVQGSAARELAAAVQTDRKSTRLNSSH